MNKDILINSDLHFMSFSKLDTINLFTFKPYNFRFNLISEEEINSNFNELQESLNYKFRKIVKGNQTHTNNVEVVTEENINDEFKDTDGLITNLKNVALITNLADCQGILLYDKEKQVIGNIHSGWKGTLNRIVKNSELYEYQVNEKLTEKLGHTPFQVIIGAFIGFVVGLIV